MSSAYGNSLIFKPEQNLDQKELCLPVEYSVRNPRTNVDCRFILDIWQESDFNELFEIFSKIIEDGQSYPQETTSREEFRQYFLSYYCFVVRSTYPNNEVAAAFYVKPNFPGRSSHLANYGLIVKQDYRQLGLANFMVEQCIRLAGLLGFQALYTNLVYENNLASIKACQRYGFQQVGRVPKAGRLKNLGFVDALQFYKQLN